jgi:Ca2+-binding EF-hand superfamily protein
MIILVYLFFPSILEFDDAFSMFSKDLSGSIKITKIFNLIRSIGHNPAEHVVWVYLNELGLTGRSSHIIIKQYLQ